VVRGTHEQIDALVDMVLGAVPIGQHLHRELEPGLEYDDIYHSKPFPQGFLRAAAATVGVEAIHVIRSGRE